MIINNSRLIDCARAFQGAERQQRDAAILVPPVAGVVVQFPSPIKDYTQINSGSLVSDSFTYSRTILQIGVNAGQAFTSAIFEQGLWRFKGWVRTDLLNAAANNLFSSLLLQAPAGSVLLATHTNTGAINKSQLTDIDLTLAIATPGLFLSLVSSQTFAGETLNMIVALACLRLL